MYEIDGEDWVVLHNGDWSGDAYVNLPWTPEGETADTHPRVEVIQGGPLSYDPKTGIPTEFEQIIRVHIPGELFTNVGRDDFRRDAISALEQLE
jgi:hypothetical protein